MKLKKEIFIGFFNLLKNKLGFGLKEIYKNRLDICLTCLYLDKNQCDICGCFVHAKTKVNYSIDSNGKSIDGCPKKYW